jgi:SAM-dependent methyltransferase
MMRNIAIVNIQSQRQLSGSNSYERELRFDILTFLRNRLSADSTIWADVCCGTGRALVEAITKLRCTADAPKIKIEGIDLAGIFQQNPFPDNLTFREISIEEWEPTVSYDLVTCVHGLHYVGDKLGVLAKIVSMLAINGIFLANLDLASIRNSEGKSIGKLISAQLRANGFVYDSRRKLLRCNGPRKVSFKLRYLGADDRVGPNYTGQSAVASYYGA